MSSVSDLSCIRFPMKAGLPFINEVYAKKHVGGQSDLPADRTLFLTRVRSSAVPLLEEALSAVGALESIQFKSAMRAAPFTSLREEGHLEPTYLCHAVFEDAEGLAEAMRIIKGSGMVSGELGVTQTVLSKMLGLNLFYADPNVVKNAVDAFMTEVDLKKQEDKLRSEMEPTVDEDGFVLVGKGRDAVLENLGGKNKVVKGFGAGYVKKVEMGGVLKLTSSEEDKKLEKKAAKKQKADDRLDFYRFQLKDKKKQEISSYRRQSERDQSQIDSMRKRNKFEKISNQ